MNRTELQAAIKALREDGIEGTPALNSKTTVLDAWLTEYRASLEPAVMATETGIEDSAEIEPVANNDDDSVEYVFTQFDELVNNSEYLQESDKTETVEPETLTEATEALEPTLLISDSVVIESASMAHTELNHEALGIAIAFIIVTAYQYFAPIATKLGKAIIKGSKVLLGKATEYSAKGLEKANDRVTDFVFSMVAYQ